MDSAAPIRPGSPPRRGEWLQIACGRRWWPLAPHVEDVDWRAIAEGLAKLPRFSGATQAAPYSVAQHCCHVASLLPAHLRLYGLLHDAHEAVLGLDWPAPLRRCAPADVRAWLDRVRADADGVIYAAAGLPVAAMDGRAGRMVRHADLVALATERRDLLPPCDAAWECDLPPPDTVVLRPWPWHEAADRWLDTLRMMLPADAPGRA